MSDRNVDIINEEIEFINKIYPNEKSEQKILKEYIKSIDIKKINSIIHSFENEFKYKFSDKFRKVITIYLIVTLERIQNNNIINRKNNADFLIKLPEYYTKTKTVAENYNEYELIKGIKYGFIELTKFRKAKPNLDNKLDQWLIFLDNKNKELLKMVTEKNKIIAKAEEKRQYLTGDAERERLQELREKAEFDEASAYEAGRKIGEKYGQKIGQEIGQEIGEKRGRKAMSIETARGMLKDKLDKKLITKYTGLTSEEIEAIAL